ncbi:hypothetical protein ACA910_021470 [Epithemia clementina (nom. ined.)]
MQRRHPTTTTSTNGGGMDTTTFVDPLLTPITSTTNTTKTTTTTTTAALRRKRKLRQLVGSHLYDDGPFLVLVGALGCGLALLIVAVGYRLLEALWDVKFIHVPHHHHHSRHMKQSGRHNHLSRHMHNQGPDASKDEDDDDQLDPLPFHPIYRVPEAMETLGDRSAEYATLRKLYDTELLPENPQRSLEFIQQVIHELPPSFLNSKQQPQHHSDQIAPEEYEDYDIHNCPYEPPRNYPREWNLVHQVLAHWSPDDTNLPKSGIHQGLCVFDYDKDYDKALHYRILEQPFVVINDPRVARTAERWHSPGYVEQMVGPNVLHRAEHNVNNHFLYHMPQPPNAAARRLRRGNRGKKPLPPLLDAQGRPAQLQNKQAVPDALRMTFGDWLSKANVTADQASPHSEHWYYRLIGCGYMGADGSCDKGSTEALFDELPFFQPLADDKDKDGEANPNALYIGDADDQKGIHCRFGMKGVIAENHFDASRNTIAVLLGQRRYILSHPRSCPNLALLPKQHESARHSAVDYTNPDLQRYPEFAHATANEVVLQPGQVLYLPTNWFHYIVSLNLNYQCNTRSGMTDHYWQPIHDCGF